MASNAFRQLDLVMKVAVGVVLGGVALFVLWILLLLGLTLFISSSHHGSPGAGHIAPAIPMPHVPPGYRPPVNTLPK